MKHLTKLISTAAALLAIGAFASGAFTPAQAFDFGLVWGWNSDWTVADSIDTTNSVFANLKGFNIYRAENPTNFVFFQSIGPTNVVRFTNQPTTAAFFFIRSVGVDGSESAPSNTNHVIPPATPSQPAGTKGVR
jgi:hypothetical protein